MGKIFSSIKNIFAILGLALAAVPAWSAPPAAEPGWKFAVLSDIHVGSREDPALSIGSFLKSAVQSLVRERPDFVVLTGDLTRGNPDDNVPLAKVRKWWLNISEAVRPLQAAGIPVLPIPGNHDFYTPAHRKAYEEAWKYFEPALAEFALQGSPPLYYSFTRKNAHFSLIKAVDQDLSPDVEAWLRKDLKQAEGAGLRFVFGHVPMASAMAKPSVSFKKQLGGLLAGGHVAAYICGHEHLNWDEVLRVNDWPFRQIIVGSAMDKPYTFPVRKELYAAHCRSCDGQCMMPATGKHFATDPKDRLQKVRQVLYMFEVGSALEGGYSAVPYTLDESGGLLPFYEPAGSGPLPPCQAGEPAPAVQ